MKIIKVETCYECPYCHRDNGGGHCNPFTVCTMFRINLYGQGVDDGKFDIKSGTHPDCKLEDA